MELELKQLSVRNFRGIRELDWSLAPGLTCLIGPGNSTKTTVLDAIAIVLSPRVSVQLSDADFYNCDFNNPIQIEAVLGGLPPELENFETYGPYICGLDSSGEVREDPEDGTERVMVFRFSVNETLEPIWEVVTPGDAMEPRRVSVGARRALGLLEVDERIDHHLRWARGSALSSITGEPADVDNTLNNAHRAARDAVFASAPEELRTASETARQRAEHFGAARYNALRPGLDPAALSRGYGLVLHHGEVPLTSDGLAARRLTSLAVQRERAGAKSLLLIDELEHGLDPHRLRRLLRVLQLEVDAGALQVVATTHSPVVVESLDVVQLAVTRSSDGSTSIAAIPQELADLRTGTPQGTVRSGSSAMLATRVLVVEGQTEAGLIRALTDLWDDEDPANAISLNGSAFRVGGSDREALLRARCLAQLGYPAAALIDSDTELDEPIAAARADGVEVIQWGGDTCMEQRLAIDVPSNRLQALLDLAVALRDDDDELTSRHAVLDQVGTRADATFEDTAVETWPLFVSDEKHIRACIGAAAAGKKLDGTDGGKPWFKSQWAGHRLGLYVADLGSELGGTDFDSALDRARQFLYPPASQRPSGGSPNRDGS